MTKRPISKSFAEFVKRARSVLWRQDGPDRVAYNGWQARIEELKKESGYTVQQATIQAAKDYSCLARLFREYDVSAFDPHPDSHPTIQTHGQSTAGGVIVNEGKELSHRENLQWAIAAAGKYLRIDESPTTTPNDAAYYLYQQAIGEPKDFLGKFNQIEAKGDSEAEERRLANKSGKRTIEEINEMLEMLSEEEKEDTPVSHP